MSDSSASTGPVSGVADRYASALFDLALSQNALDTVASDMERLQALVDGSDDLRRLVRSPVFSPEEQLGAMGAVLDRADILGLVGNFVRVVASNRRLFALPGMFAAFRRRAAEHRGETSAQVTVAQPLSDAQTQELADTLKGVVGRDVALDVRVDPSLLGGMIVKVGSRQIDTSLRTKLSSIKLALKEVG